ncbi:DUF7287 family protein [Halorientalis halophila]|uniref:DUF7287 family protein n=1 Tax=Halorientalis halophila TaxID=3108499 RepID=UPI003009C87E
MEKGNASDGTEAAGGSGPGPNRGPGESTAAESRRSTTPIRSMVASARGQTTMDFTTGVVLFVFVLIAIFTFVSGTVQPFTQGDQEDIVAVNRVADGLVQDSLGHPNEPYALNRTCTVEFFEGGTPPSDCRFDDEPLVEQLGIGQTAFVNVSVRGNVSGSGSPNELLCWDDSAGELVAQSNANCGSSGPTPLTTGNNAATATGSSVTARRAVSLHGRDVSVVVKLW